MPGSSIILTGVSGGSYGATIVKITISIDRKLLTELEFLLVQLSDFLVKNELSIVLSKHFSNGAGCSSIGASCL